MPGAPAPLRPAARLIIAGFAVSYVGTGLVLPLNAIFLASVLDHPASVVSSFYIVLPLSGMLGGLIAGRTIDRTGARAVGTVGFVLQAAAWASIPYATTDTAVPLVAAVAGLGTGIAATALRAQLSLATDPDQRARAFAVRNVVVNLGVAVGALGLAGLATLATTPYTLLYSANAASFLLFAAILLMRGGDSGGTQKRSAPRGALDRRVLAGLVGNALTVAFALTVVESVLPLMWHELMSVGLATVSVVVAIGTVVSVGVQLPLERTMRHWSPRRRFGTHTVALLLAWAIGLASTAASSGSASQIAYLVILIVVLATSECVYQAAFQPRLADIVAPSRIGSANGWVSVSFNTGSLIGSGGGVALVFLLPSAAHGFVLLALGACGAGAALQVFATESKEQK
ncbi:major facilitator transporter [Nocardioides sp. CF8]|nr:major facilitator transporter [Nocardioides sp. CF8]